MRESLGLNISHNFIRYAKIQNNGNKIIAKALGVKVYDGNPKAVINQIIQETKSEKAIINTNTINEEYYYSRVYTNKKINEQDINFEFSEYCMQNNICNDEIIGRYIFDKNNNQRKAIYIYNYANSLYNVYKRFEDPSIINKITPIATSLPNLIENQKDKNIVIINLEEVITLTTIINGQIDGVAKLNHEMHEIFQKLMHQESKFVKLYESIKNTTININNNQNKDEKNNERLNLIIPLLNKISEFLQRVKNKFEKIDEIFLTGFGANINNIDIYFQQIFPETEIKLLAPYFLPTNNNKKRFIEYNAAIALAIEGLKNEDSLNFRDRRFENKLIPLRSSNKKSNAIIDCLTIISVFAIYIFGNFLLNYQIKGKQEKVDSISNYASVQIEKAKEDKQKIESIITEYATAKSNQAVEEKKTKVNNLLNQIYYTIPKNVKLIEIKSVEDTSAEENKTPKFTIIVQSEDKVAIEKFKKDLENSTVLKNVKMSEIDLNSKTKQGSIEVEIK